MLNHTFSCAHVASLSPDHHPSCPHCSSSSPSFCRRSHHRQEVILRRSENSEQRSPSWSNPVCSRTAAPRSPPARRRPSSPAPAARRARSWVTSDCSLTISSIAGRWSQRKHLAPSVAHGAEEWGRYLQLLPLFFIFSSLA